MSYKLGWVMYVPGCWQQPPKSVSSRLFCTSGDLMDVYIQSTEQVVIEFRGKVSKRLVLVHEDCLKADGRHTWEIQKNPRTP